MIETERNKKKSEEIQEDDGKIKRRKTRPMMTLGSTLKRTTEGRKKRRVLKHAERRSRSKEARIEKDEKKKRKMKAECVSFESISNTDL